jgi:hypothetical protein
MLGSSQSLNCLLIGQLMFTLTVLNVTSPKNEQSRVIGLDDVGVIVGVGVGDAETLIILASTFKMLQ